MKVDHLVAALRNPSFALYLTGNAVSIVGTWAQRVVLFWLAWEASGSTAIIGLMAAADLLPSVLVAPFAGSLADRADRLALARRLQLLSVGPPLILLGLLWAGQITTPALLAMSLATGIVNGFDHPTRMVLVGNLVERTLVPGAVAINSIVFNLARMIGPALGGAAISFDTCGAIFVLNVVSYLGFAAILSRLTLVSRPETGPSTSVAAGWVATLSHLGARHRAVLIYFALLALCFRPVFELLPSFAETVAGPGLEAGQVFGWMTSAQALGAMVGALAVSMLTAAVGAVPIMLATGTASIVALALFLVSSGAAAALATLTFLSGAILANGVSTQVMLQTEIADTERGRVLSLYTMIFRGMPALGAFLIGVTGTVLSSKQLFWMTIPVLCVASVIAARRL